MTARTWLLLSWIVVGAAVLVAHVVLVWRVLREKEALGNDRWWALVPVATPILAVRARRWVALSVWGALLITYGVLRLLER